MTSSTHLAVSSLSKSFTLHVLGGKRIRAIRDVSFEVRRGEFVGLVGLSGSGKSTLLKCLYRTYLASAGSATFVPEGGEPVDLVRASDDRILELRRGEIGYVSQHLRPTPRVTAVDLVARPLIDLGLSRDDARDSAREMLCRLDLSHDLFDGYPALFSGGEQQRVNIARALVARRSMLLLDEPTSALDATHQQMVIDLLLAAKHAGSTIIGVFHDLRLVRQLADTYLALRDGVVYAGGVAGEVDPEALLALPNV